MGTLGNLCESVELRTNHAYMPKSVEICPSAQARPHILPSKVTRQGRGSVGWEWVLGIPPQLMVLHIGSSPNTTHGTCNASKLGGSHVWKPIRLERTHMMKRLLVHALRGHFNGNV